MEGSHSVIDHTEILNWLPFVRVYADTKYGMFCILDASTSHPSFISPWIMERSPPLILFLIKKMGRIFAMIYDYRRGHFSVPCSLVLYFHLSALQPWLCSPGRQATVFCPGGRSSLTLSLDQRFLCSRGDRVWGTIEKKWQKWRSPPEQTNRQVR